MDAIDDVIQRATHAEVYHRVTLANQLLLLLHGHDTEEYVSPGGYRLIKVTRCKSCGKQKDEAA